MLTHNLDIALQKLPHYKGIVYRSLDSNMIDDLDAFWAYHRVGQTMIYPAYTSTGKTVYDESMKIQYVIKSKTGKDISAWNPNEEEVLFERNAKLFVLKVEGNQI